MEIAIVISSVIISIVILFIATKDRWNWKRIVAISGTSIFGIIIITAAICFINYYIKGRPKVINSTWDINLGMKETDVKFMKGEPSEISNSSIYPRDIIWIYEYKNPYPHDGSIYIIRFTNGEVSQIGHCENFSYSGSDIFDYDDLHSLEDILNRFGKPSYISISDDQLKRIYSFSLYHIYFQLEQNRIIEYGIFDPNKTKPKF